MVKKYGFITLGLFLLGLFLLGCPKKIPEPTLIEKPVIKNPILYLLDAFSSAESLQARASIRIETVRRGEEVNFPLNGFLFYQKPDKLRLIGFFPLGMNVFDALYRNGEFFLLIPPQKKAYTGEVSQFGDMIEKAGEIRVFVEKSDGNEVPKRIQIEVKEKETRIELRLKEILVNSSLPEDTFQWVAPEGVEVVPLSRILRGKNLK